jgi:hypothetical protein
MEQNKTKKDTSSPELISIEELKKKYKTSDMVFSGIKALENWRTGKVISEADYQKALDEFMKAPMSGKKVAKNVKRR